MDSKMSLSTLKSKLTVYGTGLKKAKARGDMKSAKKWADSMVEIRKEIIVLTENA